MGLRHCNLQAFAKATCQHCPIDGIERRGELLTLSGKMVKVGSGDERREWREMNWKYETIA